MKFLKVVKSNEYPSLIKNGYEKIETEIWNPEAEEPDDQGGFCFSNEENIIRWIVRGDVLCDVDVEVGCIFINTKNSTTPNGIFRSNKLILRNPSEITEDLAIALYRCSNIPQKTYFQLIAIAALKKFKLLRDIIIKDHVNKSNVKEAIMVCSNMMNKFNGFDEEDMIETINILRGV